MIQSTLFAGIDHQVHDRIADLYATAAEVHAPLPDRDPALAGPMGATRVTLGRFLVSLGRQVTGQPQT